MVAGGSISAATGCRARKSLRCAAAEYVCLADGKMDFAIFSKLMPWDHAAGVLLQGEAGGYSAYLDGGRYQPARLDARPSCGARLRRAGISSMSAWWRLRTIEAFGKARGQGDGEDGIHRFGRDGLSDGGASRAKPAMRSRSSTARAARPTPGSHQHDGQRGATPAEAAEGAEFVFICVGNDDDVREVVLGPTARSPAWRKGAVLVDHTTASAEVARELRRGGESAGSTFSTRRSRAGRRAPRTAS